MKKRAEAATMRERAMHEAGHAVFRWRNSELLHTEQGLEAAVPFDQIIISPFVGADARITYRGQVIDAVGLVAGCRGDIMVETLRSVTRITGVTRARRREIVRRTRSAARLQIVSTLAGPVVEQHYIARREGYDHAYHWFDEFLIEGLLTADHAVTERGTLHGDISKSVALASALVRGERQMTRCLDEAVAEIKGRLSDDPRFWRTIEAVADAVLARKACRLGAAAAAEVMRAAWGN
jgi:hypothetical protein